MRFLVLTLLVLMVAAIVTSFAMNEAGYVLLAIGGTSIEMPLLDFVILLVAALLVLFLVGRFLLSILRAPRKLGEKRQASKKAQSRKGLMKGLIEMAGGDWQHAERSVLKNVTNSETPLLNYLVAAHAAQQQNNTKGRDDYLRKAIVSDPKAEIAVGLTQVELQIRQKQYEEALATLQHLEQLSPRHKLVKKQKGRLLYKLKDWKQLSELLPSLRKTGALSAEELGEMERVAIRARLQQVCATEDPDAVKQFWQNLPAGLRERPEVVSVYVAQLESSDKHDEAESVITTVLEKQLDERLLCQLSRIPVKNPTATLSKMESWLQQQPDNPALLMAMGRVCLQDKLWGKARSLLSQSIARRPTAEAYQALALLCEETDEPDEAMAAYKSGLNLSLKAQSC